MKTCKYCGLPIKWETRACILRIPVNPDGSPHHATCSKYQIETGQEMRLTAQKRARAMLDFIEALAAYGNAPVKSVAADEIRTRFAGLGFGGLSRSTLYWKYCLLMAEGPIALIETIDRDLGARLLEEMKAAGGPNKFFICP